VGTDARPSVSTCTKPKPGMQCGAFFILIRYKGSRSNPVLLIKFSQHRFFNPEAQVDIYISGIPAECP
jgi:hypothetical protein